MKRLVILVSSLLIFLMLLSLLLPRSVSVAKTTTINASQTKIFGEVNTFQNWVHWFPLLKENLATIDIHSEDSATIKRSSGKNIGIHFLYKTTDSLAFIASIASGATQQYVFRIEPLSSGSVRTDLIVSTTFKWYPWHRARTLFLDKLTGPQYEEVLRNLQLFCEDSQ